MVEIVSIIILCVISASVAIGAIGLTINVGTIIYNGKKYNIGKYSISITPNLAPKQFGNTLRWLGNKCICTKTQNIDVVDVCDITGDRLEKYISLPDIATVGKFTFRNKSYKILITGTPGNISSIAIGSSCRENLLLFDKFTKNNITLCTKLLEYISDTGHTRQNKIEHIAEKLSNKDYDFIVDNIVNKSFSHMIDMKKIHKILNNYDTVVENDDNFNTFISRLSNLL